MIRKDLIQQIETTLADIESGVGVAADRLITQIKTCNIEYSQGVAIGRNIRQIIIVRQLSSELEDKLYYVLSLLEASITKQPRQSGVPFELPDFAPVESEARVRRRGSTPKIFISYSQADMLAVNRIAKRLNDEFYYDVWIDYDSIPLGNRWLAEIAKGLVQADRVLFMSSPDSLASPACREEIRYAREKGKHIIPVKLTSALTWEDLEAVKLYQHQGIDFSGGESDALWDKLLDNLPPVFARDRRRLQPEFRRLHTDYLRTLFNRFGRVNLTYLLDAAPRDEVSLLDVYVPLKLTLGLTVAIEDGEMADWWVEEYLPTGERQKRERKNPAKDYETISADNFVLELLLEDIWSKIIDQKYNRRDGNSEWYLESEEASALQKHLVITGNPGSGKSTLLKYMALCMAGDQLLDFAANEVECRADLDLLGFWPHPAYTPVFIEWRDIVAKAFPALDDPRPLKETINRALLHGYLAHQLEQECGSDFAAYLDDLFDQMRDGEVIFLLDGLDEVPDADQSKRREQIKAFANMLRDLFPECRIVITSRPYAYAGDWSLAGFGQVSLAPLDYNRLEELALKLFTVVLNKEGAEEQSSLFKGRLEDVPEELRRSPLFFTLLAAIWLNNQTEPEEKRLPMGKGEIYRACVEVLIHRWTRKDLESGQSVIDEIGLDEGQLRTVLETLAYRVHRQHTGDSAGQFDAGLIVNVVRPMKIKGLDYDFLLDTLAQRAGIMYEVDPGNMEEGRDPLFAFTHRSFQEYLAACHWVLSSCYPEMLLADIRQSPSLWRNVFDLLPDEAARRKLSLWAVVKGLLPKELSLPATADDPTWPLVYYISQWLMELLPQDDDLQEIYRPRLRQALAALVKAGALAPVERAAAGRTLSQLGDPRPGTGLKDGLPDIEWLLVAGDQIKFEGQRFMVEPFQIAKYPVTYAQFQTFIDDPDGWCNSQWWSGLAADDDHKSAPGDQAFKYDNHPRERVSWYDAVAFCRWLSDRLGKDIRLPTEWEWQRAATGGDRREYSYPGDFDPSKGNTRETGIGQTSTVGIFPQGATPCGALDMSGNVWEWCLNEYDSLACVNILSNNIRALRGGSWYIEGDGLHVSVRFGYYPNYRRDYFGFRVCCGRLPPQ